MNGWDHQVVLYTSMPIFFINQLRSTNQWSSSLEPLFGQPFFKSFFWVSRMIWGFPWTPMPVTYQTYAATQVFKYILFLTPGLFPGVDWVAYVSPVLPSEAGFFWDEHQIAIADPSLVALIAWRWGYQVPLAGGCCGLFWMRYGLTSALCHETHCCWGRGQWFILRIGGVRPK